MTVMTRCPRPGCNGRLFQQDGDAVCFSCARALKLLDDPTMTRRRLRAELTKLVKQVEESGRQTTQSPEQHDRAA
jgi:uncharacterized Zn finger protein (UPF0148 family)